ncbi:MAG: 3-deoxy-7-phosphoheptulonate synthase, partial [Planctomycetota bacterium]
VPVVQELSHLPVFVDPSHAAGKRDLVPALALAAVAAGAAGLIIEVHNCPEKAQCDGPQAVLPARFTKLMEQLKQVADIVGHRVTRWGDAPAPPRRVETGGWMS